MSDRDTLPTTIIPVHYDLSLFDLELGGDWTYQGTVKITLKIQEETDQIVLNTKDVTVKQVDLRSAAAKTEHSLRADKISYHEKSEKAMFNFPSKVPATDHAVLEIQFSGILNTKMAGFSRSRYKPTVAPHEAVPQEDEWHYMFSTQFEACDARQAFPCFDEPALKATFVFQIEIPEGLVALSNMPEKETKPGKDGTKVVSFDTTPIMSTYLLAWAFGDFEYIEAFTARHHNGQKIPVRVWTTRGLKEQGQFALENGWKVLDMFAEMFDIDYALPKYDMIAVHEFAAGAMENWGLVTYRTTRLLFDEKRSDPKYKVFVAYVVAHETAHQWFGNLCTMTWWDSLFLNESFATWVGWLAVDNLYPSWNVFGQFITDGMQTAFNLDALRSSHPIEVPVRDAKEVDQIFDPISYLKGCSVIRMLAGHLGVDTFLRGVSAYLKAHMYGNATPDDLWSTLSEASGMDVNSFANTWTRAIGFPVLTIAEEPGQITIQQSRYLSTGDVKPEEDETQWWLPLGLVTNSTDSSSSALTTKEDTLRSIDSTFYKLNKDSTGFYRCNYPPPRLAQLGQQKHLLSVEDRIGLVADATALAVSGHGTTPAALALIEQFRDETNYLVWAQVLLSLDAIRSVFADDEVIAEGLRDFTLKLVTPAAEKVGWTSSADESFRDAQLRPLLLSTAGLAGHKDIIAEATRLFSQYTSSSSASANDDDDDSSALHPSLRLPVFRIATKHSPSTAYPFLTTLATSSSSLDAQETALQALGSLPTASLAHSYLTLLFSPSIAIQDVILGGAALAQNPATRLAVWHFMRDNWDTVYAKLGKNLIMLDRFVRATLKVFADGGVGGEVRGFFEGRETEGFGMAVGIVGDTIEGLAGWRGRDAGVVGEWLGARGYA